MQPLSVNARATACEQALDNARRALYNLLVDARG